MSGKSYGIVLRISALFAFIISACSTPITPEATEEIQITKPTETEEPTPTPTAPPTLTPTPEPSSTPEPAVTPGLNEDELRDLVQNLYCDGDLGCIASDTYWGGFEGARFIAVATGEIKTINILHPETGNKIAEAEVAVCVTKGLDGHMQILNMAIQLRPAEMLEINVSVIPSYISDDNEEFIIDKPLTMEELREFFIKGEKYRFTLSSNFDEMLRNFVGARWHTTHNEIVRKIYSDSNYIELLKQFTDIQGYVEQEEPLLIFPYSVHLYNR